MNRPIRMRLAIALLLLTGYSAAADADGKKIGPPSDELRRELKLDPFYKKCLLDEGFAIVSSDKVSDHALLEAAFIVDHLLAGREDLRKALIKKRIRLAVMAPTEFTLDIPEHSDLKPGGYWNKRARGLGATLVRPAVSCAEENLLCCPGDPYKGENILVHEFSHGIHEIAMAEVDRTFDRRLKDAFEQAMSDGLWKNTYSATNHKEYWAEGAQSWFHCSRERVEGDKLINTRADLKKYDLRLAKLLEEVFKDNDWTYTPPPQRKDLGHLAGYDQKTLPRFSWPKEVLEAWDRYQKEKKKSSE